MIVRPHKFLSQTFLLVCVALTPLRVCIAQEGTKVELVAKVLADQVPLNRTATYVIQLKWSGQLAQVEFDQPENPRLSNFKLAGSSSSNWVGVENGVNTAIKTFEYHLRPEGLGMGYVEGVRLSYQDKATGERHSLYAARLGIEVVEAAREPGDTPFVTYAFIVLIGWGVIALLVVAVLWWKARAKKKELARLAAQPPPPLEQEFLEQLQARVDINTMDTQAAFSELSRLLRQYLMRRFEIPAQGITTAEVLAAYRQAESSVDQAMKLEEVLQTSDVVKFSGESGDPAKLARAYALTENFLRMHMGGTKVSVE